jgi:ribosome maturation factor RimP
LVTSLTERLISRLEPVVERAGFELVDLQFVAGRNATLRLYIDRVDRQSGVDVDDCAAVSHEVSAALDADDPIPQAYSLEVSSPGFDRVLRTPAHFARFVGARVWVELLAAREGRKRYTGELLAVSGDGIELEVDRRQVLIGFAEIGKARLAPQ